MKLAFSSIFVWKEKTCSKVEASMLKARCFSLAGR
jgi:hypothetical protein